MENICNDLEESIFEALEPLRAFVKVFGKIAGNGAIDLSEDDLLFFDILRDVAEERAQNNIDILTKGIEEKLGEMEIETGEKHKLGVFREGDIVGVKLKSAKKRGKKS